MRTAHQRPSAPLLALLMLSVVACDHSPVQPSIDIDPAAAVVGEFEAQTYTFMPRAGDPVGLNLPGNPGGGGFTGVIYDGTTGRATGTFVTDILPAAGTDVFTVLNTLMATGSVSVSAVRGTFETRSGTLVDEHAADLRVIGFDPGTPGYEVVVEAVATGTVTEGTGKYGRDGGSSDLALTMMIDGDGLLPPLVVDGSFAFRLD